MYLGGRKTEKKLVFFFLKFNLVFALIKCNKSFCVANFKNFYDCFDVFLSLNFRIHA